MKEQKEIQDTIPFTNALKIIKYWGINLPNEASDLSSGKFKMLTKEIKDDTDSDMTELLNDSPEK